MEALCRALYLRAKRFSYRRQATAPLRQCWQCSPGRVAEDREAAYLAVDLETTALSPDEGEVVSVAWVVLSGGEIDLSSAAHRLVQARSDVGHSATIHHLRDCDREGGEDGERVMRDLLVAAAGKTLLLHGGALDIAFLNQLSRRYFCAPLLLPFADTLQQERRRRMRHQDVLKPGELRLADCRKHYGLPPYPAHNALSDAFATAELFLAMHAR